jgi:signal transduction histidine kinase
MKSMRLRLAVWFGLSFVTVMLAFAAVTFAELKEELHNKNWRQNYPDHPDWKIHGSYSKEEVMDIITELTETALLFGAPLAALTFLLGWWLARKSLQPIDRINDQLQTITHRNLAQQIPPAELDREFQPLVRNINDLLSRLHGSFAEMSEYAAKVAHELRTPLAILRLKVENAGREIAPELAEELQAELHRLTHVVDQSLLIAKADQGRLVLLPQTLDLSALVSELLEDFRLLAKEEQRGLRLSAPAPGFISADPKYLRQIIHNLLANALKHGQGSIHVRVSAPLREVRLTIINEVRLSVPLDHTLGLGLRVVQTLLNLHPGARYRVRRGNTYYAVQLGFPTATSPSTIAGFPSNTSASDMDPAI